GTVAQATKGKAPPFFKGPRGSGTVFPDDCWKGRASGTGEGSHPVQELLRQAARAGVRPRYLLLDRGFCSVKVVRYLQRARYPFLMPRVLRGRKADHPRGPSGSRVFALWKRSGWARYTMTSGTKERATVNVCVKCRNRNGERGKRGREALVYAYGGGLVP